MTGWFFLNRNFVIYSYIGSLGPSMFHPNAPSRSTTRALQYIGLMGLWPPKRKFHRSPIQQPTRGWQNHPQKGLHHHKLALGLAKSNNSVSFHEISGSLWLLPELVVVYPCDSWIRWLWHWKYEAYFWDWKAGQLIFTTEKNKHTFAKRGQPDILFLAKDVVFFSPQMLAGFLKSLMFIGKESSPDSFSKVDVFRFIYVRQKSHTWFGVLPGNSALKQTNCRLEPIESPVFIGKVFEICFSTRSLKLGNDLGGGFK